MDDLIKRADAVKTVIRKCSPICDWQVGTQQYPDCVVAEINALPSADAVHIHNDGTLEVKVPNAQKVGRVLVMDTDSNIGGGLFYPDDAVQGEWVYDHHNDEHTCSVCGRKALCDDYVGIDWQMEVLSDFCPNCGAKMKGGAE